MAKTSSQKASSSRNTLALPPEVKRELVYLEPHMVTEDKKNPRLPSPLDRARAKRMAKSISENRQQQPILVWKEGNKYPMVFGHRRREACLELKTKVMALVLSREPSESEKMRLRSVENLDREDLNPAERAVQVLNLFEANGMDVNKTAADLGWDVGEVQNYLYLQVLPLKVRNLLADGTVNLAQARQLVKAKDPAAMEKHAAQIAEISARGIIVPASDVTRWLENEKRALVIAPWKLTVVFGPLKLACIDCPHNDANDPMLFETTSKDPAKGFCRNNRCFEAKAEKYMQAQEKAEEKATKRLKDLKIKKDSAEAPAVISEVVDGEAPDFVQPAALKKSVSAVMGVSNKPAAAKSAKPDRDSKPEDKPSEKELRQRALLDWAEHMRDWQAGVGQEIRENLKKHARLGVAYLLLSHSKSLENAATYPLPIGEHDLRSSTWKNPSPKAEEPITPTVDGILTAAAKWHWDSIAEDLQHFTQWGIGNLTGCGPELVRRIAGIFNVMPKAAPAFEDFLPEEMRPAKPAAPADEDFIYLAKAPAATVKISIHKSGSEFYAGLVMEFPQLKERWNGPVANGACFAKRELAIAAAADVAEDWFGNHLLTKMPSHKDNLLAARDTVRRNREQLTKSK